MRKLYIIGGLLTAIVISSCSSNQELAQLEEVDDVYYRAPKKKVALVDPDSPVESVSFMDGASDAERSYYEGGDYVPPAQTQSSSDSDYDYYDEDYARRLENFSDSTDESYIFDYDGNTDYSEIYETENNYPPTRFRTSFGFGYNTFYGPHSNIGMSMGYSNYPTPYGTPYPSHIGGYNMNPWSYGVCVNYGFGYNSFYNPYGYYGSPYYTGYWSPYTPIYDPYGRYYYDHNPYVVNDPRSTSSRASRGGVIPPSGNDGGINGISTVNRSRNSERMERTASNLNRNDGSGISTDSRTSRRDYTPTRSRAGVNERRLPSPADRVRSDHQRARQSGTYQTRYGRSGIRTTSPSRTRSSGSGSPSYQRSTPSRPSMNRGSSPSYSPSRSSGSRSGSSSPSRSGSSSRRR